MSSINKLTKIADRFERKISKIAQLNTTMQESQIELNEGETKDLQNLLSKFLQMKSLPMPIMSSGKIDQQTQIAIKKAKEILGKSNLTNQDLLNYLRTNV